MPTPSEYLTRITADLASRTGEFDAIVVGGDPHATAIGGIAAAILRKPLMTVCGNPGPTRVSDIVTVGDIDPRMRFLYIDDFFAFGGTLRHTFDYMNQSAHANIVATYEAVTREYSPVRQDASKPTDSDQYI